MSGAARPAIVIAAGGAGLRLGGNKPARLLAGRPLLDHVLDWARRSSDCLALAVADAARGAGEVTPPGLPLLRDAQPDLGPIAALASAFTFAAAQGRSHVLLVACDMPLLPDDLVPRLSAAIGAAGAAMPATGGLLHPLAALWRADPAALDAYVAAGGRAPRGYAAEAGLVTVDWPDRAEDGFLNVNTPDDLAAAEAVFRKRAR